METWLDRTHPLKVMHTVQMMASYATKEHEKFCFQLMLSYEEIDCQEKQKYYVKNELDELWFTTAVFMDKSFEASFCWMRNVFTKTYISTQINFIILTWFFEWILRNNMKILGISVQPFPFVDRDSSQVGAGAGMLWETISSGTVKLK